MKEEEIQKYLMGRWMRKSRGGEAVKATHNGSGKSVEKERIERSVEERKK